MSISSERESRILSLRKRIKANVFIFNADSDLSEDLTSAGWIGAIRSVDRYDNRIGCTLDTFANRRIRGSMLDELRTWDCCHRSHRKDIQLGRSLPIISLGVSDRHSVAPSEEKKIISSIDIKSILRNCLLTKLERIILNNYFFKDMKMKEIGIELDLSEGRVSQLVKSAIGKLRLYLSAEKRKW